MTEVFTLSWDEFQQKCPKAFKDLWLDTDLSDVTLATEDGCQLSAHKVILAACSPLFKRLLQKNQNVYPLLYLMGVQLSQLQQLLSYIYLGQCDLTQDQLPAFMATGNQLEVEGLSGDLEEKASTGEVGGKLQKQYQIQKKKLTSIDDIRMPQEHKDDEIEKMESLNDNATFEANAPMSNNEKSNTSPKQLQCQFCDYRPTNTSNIKHHVENVHQGLKYNCADCDYRVGDKSNLKKHVEKTHLGITYTCEICRQVFNLKSMLKRHVDIAHNGRLFNCEKCRFTAAAKYTLDNHIWKQPNTH